jgi:hypothetical protein
MNIQVATFDNREIKEPCKSVGCTNIKLKNSKYCSKDCGISTGKLLLTEMLKALPLSTIKRKTTENNEDIKKLQKLILNREMRKINIRNLEAKQRFIDDCIELVGRFRSNDSQKKKRCGFDSLILDLDLSDFQKQLDEAPAENEMEIMNEFVDTIDAAGVDTIMAPVINLELRNTMCKNEGKCSRHDGWEFIKSQEIQLELDEEISGYCLEKKMEVELAISSGLYREG